MRISYKQRKEQIISEATRLFSQFGFEKVTIKMLASSCGISEAALYRYFPSKENLYDAVLTLLKNRLNPEEFFSKIDTLDDIEELLTQVAKHIVDVYSQNKELIRLLFYSSLEGHPLAKKVFAAIRTPYIAFLNRKLINLQKSKKIKRVHPEITARCFVGMVMDCSLGTHLWKGLEGKYFKPEEVIKNNIPIYACGLRKTKK